MMEVYDPSGALSSGDGVGVRGACTLVRTLFDNVVTVKLLSYHDHFVTRIFCK